MQEFELKYDPSKFREKAVKPVNTLQLFITTFCNKRCRACFYGHQLGHYHMTMEEYAGSISDYREVVDKIILLGGEPTMHPYLQDMLALNEILGIKTTVYTNGYNLKAFDGVPLNDVSIRIGVYGANTSEKALSDVKSINFPVTIVFMIRKDNIEELPKVAQMAEDLFDCKDFYISSIRDIAATRSYWIDNEETVPLDQYFYVVQDFVNRYDGKMNLHISRRGVIRTPQTDKADPINGCRFGNIFPDGRKIICPFDISLEKYSSELQYGRNCNKNSQCILQKVVLERI